VIEPQNSGTKVDGKSREWLPADFSCFLEELAGLQRVIQGDNSPPVFRGHANRSWLLDSTFVRDAKRVLFGVPAEAKVAALIADSLDYHLAILNLFLLKFGVIGRPSDELERLASEKDLDSWFEFMKRLQQYPGDDHGFIRGTNLIDWTQSPEVALYFANLNREGDGAVFVCNTKATGRTLQTKPVGEILDLMGREGNAGRTLGVPLLFCPSRQLANKRANNQQAVYFSQMEMRLDCEAQWRAVERENPESTVVVKLILPDGTQSETAEYLDSKGITDQFVFPEET